MKLLIYSDGRPASVRALQFGACLARKIDAELSVLTVRTGTHATEPPPPIGQDVDLGDRWRLSSGLQILADAVDVLVRDGLLVKPGPVRVSELPNGHLFVCRTEDGKRIAFYVCFGPMIQCLNHEVDRQRCDLLIIAPPRRGRFYKMVLGDTTRKLILDLHTSVLIVRGGGPASRFVACVDGSPASGRLLPMLGRFLLVLPHPLEMVWVRSPAGDIDGSNKSEQFIESVAKRLSSGGHPYKIVKIEGKDRAAAICAMAGDDAVIFLGASLRHDVYRRLKGSLPLQIAGRTASSVLVVKGLPEGDPDALSV